MQLDKARHGVRSSVTADELPFTCFPAGNCFVGSPEYCNNLLARVALCQFNLPSYPYSIGFMFFIEATSFPAAHNCYNVFIFHFLLRFHLQQQHCDNLDSSTQPPISVRYSSKLSPYHRETFSIVTQGITITTSIPAVAINSSLWFSCCRVL